MKVNRVYQPVLHGIQSFACIPDASTDTSLKMSTTSACKPLSSQQKTSDGQKNPKNSMFYSDNVRESRDHYFILSIFILQFYQTTKWWRICYFTNFFCKKRYCIEFRNLNHSVFRFYTVVFIIDWRQILNCRLLWIIPEAVVYVLMTKMKRYDFMYFLNSF